MKVRTIAVDPLMEGVMPTNDDRLFLLLSSAAQRRYKDDILRALAMPVGSRLQFRYRQAYVSKEVLDVVGTQIDRPLGRALICYVDHDDSGVLPIVPVRLATIDRANLHGSTLSVTMSVGDLAYSSSPSDFAQQVTQLSQGKNPRKDEEKISGSHFLLLPDKPPVFERGRSIARWEQIIDVLYTRKAFAKHSFFWTVLGLVNVTDTVDTNTFSDWPHVIAGESTYDLLLYHYLPHDRDISSPSNVNLALTVGGALRIEGPPVVPIDSRYDLVRWRITADAASLRTTETWMRIEGEWNVDLGMAVGGALAKSLFLIMIGGTFVAGPAILSMIQASPYVGAKLVLMCLVSWVSGVVAAATVLFGIQRIRP
jgi:hypothetical protein